MKDHSDAHSYEMRTWLKNLLSFPANKYVKTEIHLLILDF